MIDSYLIKEQKFEFQLFINVGLRRDVALKKVWERTEKKYISSSNVGEKQCGIVVPMCFHTTSSMRTLNKQSTSPNFSLCV